MRIELKELKLKNFKGIRDLTVNFGRHTNISGENATGKTTINDAFRWLLFDKDSNDRKDFNIKTLDDNNQALHGLEYSVTGTILVDGKENTFQKILKEKWQKKRGEADATFTGHETLYLINDVPMKQSEYKDKITSIIDETLFKLLTDPLYFSQQMKWQERRDILVKIVDGVTTFDVLDSSGELDPLARILLDMSIEDLRKSNANKKKRLNDEAKSIPFRIDECNNSIRDVESLNDLKAEMDEKEKEIVDIDDSIADASKEDPEILKKKALLNKKRTELNSLEIQSRANTVIKRSALQDILSGLKSEQRQLINQKDQISKETEQLKGFIDKYESEADNYRKLWFAEKEAEFKITSDFTCPTCGRLLDKDVIESRINEMTENFNSAKVKSLEELNKLGKSTIKTRDETEAKLNKYNKEIEKLTERIARLKIAIENKSLELESFSPNQEDSKDIDSLKSEITEIENYLQSPRESSVNFTALKLRKIDLKDRIEVIKKELNQVEINKQMNDRIRELSNRERELSQQIADLEMQEFLCEKFLQREAELLEKRVNDKFRFVKFKLFNTLINGGVDPTCEALISGVPFIDANHAAKVNAGIDIINALSEFYNVSAPIFIDNREAVNEIIPTGAQIINLIVSFDKKLRIENQSQSQINKKVA